MTFLSSTAYSTILSTINSLASDFQQISFQRQSQLQLLRVRVEYVNKVVQKQRKSIEAFPKQSNSSAVDEIDRVKSESKQRMRQIKRKYENDEQEQMAELIRIQSQANSLLSHSNSQFKSIAHSILTRLEQSTNKLSDSSARYDVSFKELQDISNEELQLSAKKIEELKEANREEYLLERVEGLRREAEDGMAKLKKDRKHKKDKFLQLLDTIVSKLKQAQSEY